MITTQESFDTYWLLNLYNILKARDYEVKEIVEENNKMKFGGPTDLVLKTTGKAVDTDNEVGEKEEVLC